MCTIAGKVPVDLLLQRNRALYNVGKDMDATIGELTVLSGAENAANLIRDEVINLWQAEWALSSQGRITFAYFGNINDRLNKLFIYVNHWSSQILTGHGDFHARLVQFRLVNSEICSFCGEEDTAQHFLLLCKRFEPQRVALRDVVIVIGEWKWPSVAQFFVSTREAYSLLVDFCRETLWLKSLEM